MLFISGLAHTFGMAHSPPTTTRPESKYHRKGPWYFRAAANRFANMRPAGWQAIDWRQAAGGRLEAGGGWPGGSRMGHRLQSAADTPTPYLHTHAFCVRFEICWETTIDVRSPAAGFRPPAAPKWPALPPHRYLQIDWWPPESTMELFCGTWALGGFFWGGVRWGGMLALASPSACHSPARFPAINILLSFGGRPICLPPTDRTGIPCESCENVAGNTA